ncbi:MAG: 50S ribosomal protein L17 [Candidatus Beckwithbacteria bacterium]
MKHRMKGKKLGRNIKQRKALFKSLITNLIFKQQIKTTEAKAKAIKPLIDKLMTKAKQGSLSYRRQVIGFLSHQKAANHLFDVVAPQTKKRTSGFTRVVRLGQRKGDNTMMAKIEFVDKKSVGSELSATRNEVKGSSEPSKK